MTTPDADEPSLAPEIEKLKKQVLADRRSKAFIPLAEAYVKAGMLREAALALEDGLKEFPSFITALVALGRVCIQLDDIPRASQVLQEAIKISPDNVLAHRMLARLYVNEQTWEAAKRSCEMVLFGYPKDEEMLALQAEIAQHIGGETPPPPPSPPEHTPGPRKVRAGPPPAAAQSPPARGPSSAAALFGAAAEPPAAAPPRARPAVGGKVARLQSLLARIQARRSS